MKSSTKKNRGKRKKKKDQRMVKEIQDASEVLHLQWLKGKGIQKKKLAKEGSSLQQKESKIEKWRKKPLFHELKLEPNPNIPFIKAPTSQNSQNSLLERKKIRKLASKILEENKLQTQSVNYDIWGGEQKESSSNSSNNSQIVPSSVKPLEDQKLSSHMEIYESGYSYNPSEQDHQNIVSKAIAQQLQEKKEQQIRQRKVKQKETKLSGAKRLRESEQEQQEKKLKKENNNENASPNQTSNSNTNQERTKAERKQEKRKKRLLLQQYRKERWKQQQQDFQCLPQIIQEIEKQKERKERKKQLKEQKKLEQETLKEEPKIQVIPSQPLHVPLRKTKTLQNPLNALFENLQRKNAAFVTKKKR